MPLALASLALAVSLLTAPTFQPTADIGRHFEGMDGTFVLLNGRTGEVIRHNPGRAAQRFAPCSTYKIPNTAILLESGAAPSPAHKVQYDPALDQPDHWARDFDLTTAFKASALWYYQALARRAGIDVQRRFLQQFRYGNADASGGLERTGSPFWVDGTLRISADEQVAFLRRLYEGELGLSERTTALTKEIMVVEATADRRLSAKTGACRPAGEPTANWYVGIVERGPQVYYFALQIGAPEYGRAFSGRIPIARAILEELGAL